MNKQTIDGYYIFIILNSNYAIFLTRNTLVSYNIRFIVSVIMIWSGDHLLST